tara:strand:- start:307 stop:1146 length:840 start_codon:yes stop_codon:yes gene_type:complete
MKFTKEDLVKIIEQETEEVEAEEGLKALEKQLGRREFLKKFGASAAGIIGTGAAASFWGKIAGRMAQQKKDKGGTGDIQMAVGKGKPQNMMPGLVPGDKINPIWDVAPFTVQGMSAIFVSPDQIPDDYMIPGRNIPAKGYREQLLKQYGKADLQTLRKRIESTGTWATSDYGFDYYPGPYWPDDVESPQPTLEDGPIPGVGYPMLPPDWSIALELYQLKILAQPQMAELPNMDAGRRKEIMQKLGFSDEIFLLDAYEKAQQLKNAEVINENKKINIKIT